MSVPVLIMVGSDKGGVGKTMFTRALLEYDPLFKANAQLFDTEPNQNNLKRYYPSATLLDITNVNDQMRLFDNLSQVNVVDIRAGLLSTALKSMRDLNLIGDTAQREFNLVVFHVMGGSISSMEEISATSDQLQSDSDEHIIVKNYVSDSEFFDFDKLTADKYFKNLDIANIVTVAHLPGRVQEAVDLSSKTFRNFVAEPGGSTVLKRHLSFWMGNVHKELDRIKLKEKLV